MVKGIGTYIKNEDLKCLECKKEDEKEDKLEIHYEYNLVRKVVEAALKLEELLRIYMNGSKLSTVQCYVEQNVGQHDKEWDSPKRR